MTSPSGSTDASPLRADVVIIGGGLVGGIMAAALDAVGLDTVVVDRESPAATLDSGFDGRASALALASQRALDALRLWEFLAPRAAPIHDIRVSDGNSLLFLHYDHRDLTGAPFGFMVENRDIRAALADRIPRLSHVRYLAPAAPAGLEATDGGVAVTLGDGRRIRAALAIGADGRGSWLRGHAGIPLTRWSYEQAGIVCAVDHELPHDNIAHEHFLPAGPFAILPLRGNRSSIVWTERAEVAPAMMALRDEAFLGEVSQRLGDFLGVLRIAGPRWCYPLSLQYAQRSVGPRMALIGDAAHAMHPIAGQGLNMGIRDVAALAEVLADTARLGLDIGSASALDGFARWRRFDNHMMLAATDGLNRLFSNRAEPLRIARDIGLAVVDKMRPLKRAFVREAMGLSGDLPRLLRGETP